MASNEVEIRVTADTKGAERGLSGMRGSLSKFSRQARIAGAALTAIAAGGAIFMKSMAQAALVQQKAVDTLAATMSAQGESFASLEDHIMSATAALQKKTNFGDEVQIQALARLTASLGDTETALDVLPVLIDLAAFRGKDLTQVVETLGPVLAGTTHNLASLSMKFDESEGTMARADRIMSRVGGTAEAVADPFTQMGNAVGDVKEKIGEQFLPVVAPLLKMIQKLAENLQEMNPRALRMIALVVIGTVAFATIAGPILLLIGFLPLLAGGFAAVAAAAWPVTLGVAGIAAAVFAGILIWRNWDAVVAHLKRVYSSNFGWLMPGGVLIKAILFLKDNWREVWSRIQEIFRTVVTNILGGAENVLNVFVDMVNGVLRIAKRLGFMSDVAEIDKFAFDYDAMMVSIKKKTIEVVDAVSEKAKELGTSIKADLGDAWLEAQESFNGFLDNVMGGVDDLEKQVKKTNEELGVNLPDAAEKGGTGLEALGDEYSKAGDKIKTFNELVQAGQFQTRVRGGMPEVVAWGEGGAERRGIPSMDIFAQKALLLTVSRVLNQSERQQRLASTLSTFGGPVVEELKFMVEHIRSAVNFTQQGIAEFATKVNTNAAIQAREQAIKAAWAVNRNNPLNTRVTETRMAQFGIAEEDGQAKGGIVTRPTIALVGEAGPEAIIPLRGGRGLAPVYNITISGNTVFGEMDFQRLVVDAVTDSHRRGGLPFLGR